MDKKLDSHAQIIKDAAKKLNPIWDTENTFTRWPGWPPDEVAKPVEEMSDDEQADEIVKRLKTKPPVPLSNIHIPLIRRVIPSLIADSIISVQPMSPPAGIMLNMRFTKNRP